MFVGHRLAILLGLSGTVKSLTGAYCGDKFGAVVNLILRKGARFMFSNFASVIVRVQAWARLPF